MANTRIDESLGNVGRVKNFYSLYVDALQADEVLDFDLFLQTNREHPPVLYRERRLPLTQEALNRLRDAHVNVVYVPEEQRVALKRYLEKHLSSILQDPNVPVDEKAELLYFSAQEVVREVLDNPFAGSTLINSHRIVGHAIDFLFREERAFSSLLRITSYDYYTYTHSVNVMVYGMALGRRVGLGGDELLMRFGEALLLHDIGKSRVDSAVLNHPGKLSEEQWEAMRRHPLHGRDILVELGVNDELILDVVTHHHEKLNGKGYPHGLSAEDIVPAIRVCTIADIFDALTTRRVYKDAVSTFDALRLMKSEMAVELDPAYFRTFVQLMGVQ